MRTNFTKKQLQDPRLAEVDRIIRSCVHCGLCTAVCSSYVILGDERDSPRGRIYLLKDMFESERNPSSETRHHIDRCLSCLSCMTTCPSGVDYMHLVDHGREYIEEREIRSRAGILLRTGLLSIIPYPNRFRLMLYLGRLVRPFRKIMRGLGLKELASMIDMVPSVMPPFQTLSRENYYTKSSQKKGTVILLAGCAQQILKPAINSASIRLLNRCHYDVMVPFKAGCCGALSHHLGRGAETKNVIKKNIDAWMEIIEKQSIDAILINASGCGTMVKDYGYILRHDPEYASKAKQVSNLTKDISEFLFETRISSPVRWSSIKVAYHAACSLQHGQKILEEPKSLLSQAGYTVVDIPEGHLCCGSAGTYNILQSDIAAQLLSKKVANIQSQDPDIVAAGNIGCITQISGGVDIPVVHTVELLDWAYGGPIPEGVGPLAKKVQDLPKSALSLKDYLQA